jgi:hypothetical protein
MVPFVAAGKRFPCILKALGEEMRSCTVWIRNAFALVRVLIAAAATLGSTASIGGNDCARDEA